MGLVWVEADKFVTGVEHELNGKELIFFIFCGRAWQIVQLVSKLNARGQDFVFVVYDTPKSNDPLSGI